MFPQISEQYVIYGSANEQYDITRAISVNTWLALYIIAVVFEMCDCFVLKCSFQFNLSSIIAPTHFALYTLSIEMPLIPTHIFTLLSICLFPNLIWLVLLIFRDNLFTAKKKEFSLSNAMDNVLLISLASSPDKHMLVSSANNTDLSKLDTLAISFTYSLKRLGPKIDPCGTPHTTFIAS